MSTPTERVFPIRLAVNGHVSAAGRIRDGNNPVSPHAYSTATEQERPRPDTQENSPDVEMTDFVPSPGEKDPLLSTRSDYTLLRDGTHGVIQGNRRGFTRCEDELIHIPGAVQSHGMLVALKVEGNGRLSPRIVSENSHMVCHTRTADILAMEDFNMIMPAFQRPIFAAQMRCAYRASETSGKGGEPSVFDFSFFDPQGKLVSCWCALHYSAKPGLYICEFELQDQSQRNLLGPGDQSSKAKSSRRSRSTDLHSRDGSDYMGLISVTRLLYGSQTELPESDGLKAKDSLTSMELITVATKIGKQFAEAQDLQQLLQAAAGVIKELSGFSRTMIYQFDPDFNGTVVAETMDSEPSRESFLGLHFPASDIPPQARKLYMMNKVRVLFDCEQETARLVAKDKAAMAEPLDLTHAYLRAMSPVHLKYLANMGVRSSMSMSLEYDGKLWGLIVCHSYGTTANRVPFSMRELCHFVSVTASTCLEKILNAEKLQSRQVMTRLQNEADAKSCLTASSSELLKLFDAECGFLVADGEVRTIGRLSSYVEAVTLLKYMFYHRPTDIVYSSNVTEDFKDLVYPPGFQALAGVLYIPLAAPSPTENCIIFFRKNQLREVHWAGRAALDKKNGNRLEPRNSFEKWTEVAQGCSKQWTLENANIAAMAQLVFGTFIRVWREKAAALRETRLKRLLLRDTSHQVRTPLNAAINYLEIVLEKPELSESTREALSTSWTSCKTATCVIDEMLALTGSISGSISQLTDPFDISVCIEETLSPLTRAALAKGLTLVFKADNNVTRNVRGDMPSFQRALLNLVANAIEHTKEGQITVQWSEPATHLTSCVARISVADMGPGFSERELDDMFQEFEQVPDEDLEETTTMPSAMFAIPRRDDVLRVGIGLSFVARYVKVKNGQLGVRSAKGHGSTFTLEIPFILDARTKATPIAERRGSLLLPVLPMPEKSVKCHPSVSEKGADGPVPGPQSPSAALRAAARRYSLSPPIVAPCSANMTPLTPVPARKANLVVLAADDNNLNVTILNKRLSKLGHNVRVSRDGQECLAMFKEQQSEVDFVLMDINDATRMIRDHEKAHPLPTQAVQSCGRTPIFAISGMLTAAEKQLYIDGGFDGWMPKPVNLKLLVNFLYGALDPEARRQGLYREGEFERGGWFC